MIVTFRILYTVVLFFFISACKQDQTPTEVVGNKKTVEKHSIINIENAKESIKSISKKWQGKYEGVFLRIPKESADPRAWASLEIKIKSDKLLFYYFSYPEQDINQILTLIEEKQKSLLFNINEGESPYNKCLIYLKEGNFLFESHYINQLMGFKQIIKLDKITATTVN